MTIYVIDTETTGFEHETNSLVEFAAVDERGEYHHGLVRPEHRITYGAMATHHITEDMVKNSPPLEEVIGAFVEPDDDTVFVAHNAEFDKKFLPEWMQKKPWICTYRCALHLLPDAESHSNMALAYEFGLDWSDVPPEAGNLPHRALFDAWVTKKLFDFLLGDRDVGEMIRLTSAPVLQKKVRFGKHYGELWENVPKSYLSWILRQDFDEDVQHTARHHLR